MNNLIENVEMWATERGLNTTDPSKQMIKLVEEVGEVAGAFSKEKTDELMLEIGDVTVVLIILCLQLGFSLDECLGMAYSKIKNRKGKTVNGTFIKEEDC